MIPFVQAPGKNHPAREHEIQPSTVAVVKSKRKEGPSFPPPSRGRIVPAPGVFTAHGTAYFESPAQT
jgi:hypothetical protein